MLILCDSTAFVGWNMKSDQTVHITRIEWNEHFRYRLNLARLWRKFWFVLTRNDIEDYNIANICYVINIFSEDFLLFLLYDFRKRGLWLLSKLSEILDFFTQFWLGSVYLDRKTLFPFECSSTYARMNVEKEQERLGMIGSYQTFTHLHLGKIDVFTHTNCMNLK